MSDENDEVVVYRRFENGKEWIEDADGNHLGDIVRSIPMKQRTVHITENGVYVDGAKLPKATHE